MVKALKIKEPELNPAVFMQQAIDKGLTPEVMEKFMNLYDRWESKKAKREFDLAMAAFQGECPVIVKEKGVKNKDGSARYKYAPLDQIVKQTGKIIAKHGLSYTINATVEGQTVKAEVVVTHEGGHSQPSSFMVPLDNDSFMNAAQRFGSALTYAKRYAFCNAFGILTQDVDKDAQDLHNGAHGGADDKTYAMALTSIAKAKTIPELVQFKTSLESGRGMKLYNDDQRGQLLRMIDGKAKELGG